MDIEKQVSIYESNIGYLTNSTELKVEAWNNLIMLHHMKLKENMGYDGFGWDCHPANYEPEKTFQFSFNSYFGRRDLISIRHVKKNGDVTLTFRDSVVLSSRYSMLDLSNLILKLYESTKRRAFIYEEGQIHVLKSKYGKKIGVAEDEILKELNEHITTI
mgnify:CR=1 FL=1|tara:strand:+ start:2385 stop:2864 length:480 start_codon:yes stop_codon:yes gene_type:complete